MRPSQELVAIIPLAGISAGAIGQLAVLPQRQPRRYKSGIDHEVVTYVSAVFEYLNRLSLSIGILSTEWPHPRLCGNGMRQPT